MFAKIMITDRWESRRDNGATICDPTWDEVKRAIESLDGKQRTMVHLSERPGGNCYMIIAGQWDSRVLVNTTKNDVDFFSLVDPQHPTTKVTLYIGGQDGEYEERKCVPIAWGIEAARSFYELGELKCDMNWVSDY